VSSHVAGIPVATWRHAGGYAPQRSARTQTNIEKNKSEAKHNFLQRLKRVRLHLEGLRQYVYGEHGAWRPGPELGLYAIYRGQGLAGWGFEKQTRGPVAQLRRSAGAQTRNRAGTQSRSCAKAQWRRRAGLQGLFFVGIVTNRASTRNDSSPTKGVGSSGGTRARCERLYCT
jgi:hypothetical protein